MCPCGLVGSNVSLRHHAGYLGPSHTAVSGDRAQRQKKSGAECRAALKLQRGQRCSDSGRKPHASVFELAGVHVQGVRAECGRLRLQGRR